MAIEDKSFTSEWSGGWYNVGVSDPGGLYCRFRLEIHKRQMGPAIADKPNATIFSIELDRNTAAGFLSGVNNPDLWARLDAAVEALVSSQNIDATKYVRSVLRTHLKLRDTAKDLLKRKEREQLKEEVKEEVRQEASASLRDEIREEIRSEIKDEVTQEVINDVIADTDKLKIKAPRPQAKPPDDNVQRFGAMGVRDL
jgi:hypothetical protein